MRFGWLWVVVSMAALEGACSNCVACNKGEFASGCVGIFPGKCNPCPAGAYSVTTYTPTCTYCAAGTSTNYATGSTTCYNCAPGTYAASQAQESCTGCPPNTFAPNQGSTACTACTAITSCSPFETFTPCTSTHDAACSSCPTAPLSDPYSYDSNCMIVCNPGYTLTPTKTNCQVCGSACLAGSYFSPGTCNTTLDYACAPCPAGTYTAAPASACASCQPGYYSNASATACAACVNCPNGTFPAGCGSGPGECTPCKN